MADTRRTRASATRWAHKVSEDEPHDLRELEDQLRDQAEPSQTIRPLTIVGILALIAGVTVFIDASGGIRGDSGQTFTFDFGVEFEFAVSAVCFVVVCLFQAQVLRLWWANGKVRDSATTAASTCVAVVGLVVLSLVVIRLDATGLTVWTALVIAIIIVACVGALTGVVFSVSGRKPSTWHSSWNEAPMVNLAALPREKQLPLLASREKALRILARRGLLDADEKKLAELAARPLGRLDAD